jgi:hypothetical protein
MNSGSRAKLKILRAHLSRSLFFRSWYGVGKVSTHFVFEEIEGTTTTYYQKINRVTGVFSIRNNPTPVKS